MTNGEKLSIMIEMNGRTYRQIVDKEDFENVYQPRGWRADVQQFKTQIEVANYNKMIQVKEKKFDDNLFKRG